MAKTEKIIAVIARVDVLMDAARQTADSSARPISRLARCEADAVLRALMMVRHEIEGLLPRNLGRRTPATARRRGKTERPATPAAPE
jgi:hypothetical protein